MARVDSAIESFAYVLKSNNILLIIVSDVVHPCEDPRTPVHYYRLCIGNRERMTAITISSLPLLLQICTDK